MASPIQKSARVPLLWLLLAGLVPAVPVLAQDPNAQPAQEEAPQDDQAAETPRSVEDRLDEIDQRLLVLDRQTEIDKEQAADKAKTATSAAASKDGFVLKSADGAFQLKLRGLINVDARFFGDDVEKPGVDTFLLRRVRPILEGTVFKIFDFRFTPDFGGGTTVLQDAYIDARFSPAFRVRTGKLKTPFGIERLQSASDLLFVERGLPNNLVPNRDVGVQLGGDLAGGRLAYAAGVFNGVPDGGSSDLDSGSGKDLAARLFFSPFAGGDSGLKGLGFGIAATHGEQRGSVTSPGLFTYRTGGQASFFSFRSDATAAGTAFADGSRTRWSPQLTWYAGPFGLLSEYVVSAQEVRRGAVEEKLENRAWQVAGSWVLTGGDASYRGVAPKHPFDLASHAWGAFEIAARYNVLDVDDDAFPLFANPASSSSRAEAWALGLNWYLNRNVRWMLDYEQTTFDGGAASGDREDEKALLNRFQISF